MSLTAIDLPPSRFFPAHHPGEDTLLRHAAGTLPPGLALVVAAHLPFCPDCQEAVRLGEATGGVLLAEMPAAELAPDALSRTLARLDLPTGTAASIADTVMLAPGVPLPAALQGLVRPGWRWLAPGISRIAVDTPVVGRGNTPATVAPNPGRDRVYLLRVAPGNSLPDHGHHGWEATCVLAGSFTDATGKYGPGDVAEMDVNAKHQPVAGAGDACICLIASEGRLRMRGLLARLVQPLIGV
jgi:putative transcriptional regulator